MMEWKKLLTPKRLGKDKLENLSSERTPFQRDYDRLVFSSPFRRLKDKTQVFPLAKNDRIRTRLIHSLEVSCVGRSLGRIVGAEIIDRHHLQSEFSTADFGDIVSAACIAHDIGNPPFGHAGEDAIRTAFSAWHSQSNKADLSASQISDFEYFEGNAQGFRILTRLEMSPSLGGMQLTCPTLAAFTKYPRESPTDMLDGYSGISVKKYGFFQAEKELFTEVADTVGLIERDEKSTWRSRHPLAFLVEAADDICYSIIDVEDGYRMGYVPFKQAKTLLGEIAQASSQDGGQSQDEKIKELRAKAIDKLTREAAKIFLEFESEILQGKFDRDLLSESKYSEHLQEIEIQTNSLVFENPDVVCIKIAGYEVLGQLFTEFANACFDNSNKSHLMRLMLPVEDRPEITDDSYHKLLKITDYISGMTDSYATNLFQQLRGISL
jgi:dGTPase